jgi:hypothetical protein
VGSPWEIYSAVVVGILLLVGGAYLYHSHAKTAIKRT